MPINPCNIALRETRSNAPTPSTERIVALGSRSPVRLVESSQTTQFENLQSCGRDMTSRQEGGDLAQQLRISLGLKKRLQVFASHPVWRSSSSHEFEWPRGNQSHRFRIGWLPRCGGSACRIPEDVQRVPVSWRHPGRLKSLVCSRQLSHQRLLSRTTHC